MRCWQGVNEFLKKESKKHWTTCPLGVELRFKARDKWKKTANLALISMRGKNSSMCMGVGWVTHPTKSRSPPITMSSITLGKNAVAAIVAATVHIWRHARQRQAYLAFDSCGRQLPWLSGTHLMTMQCVKKREAYGPVHSKPTLGMDRRLEQCTCCFEVN